MATYAIGDVQGCFEDLKTLLSNCNFDSAKDHLWFAGDLINRGPDSLGTLRFIKSVGATCVLGNHDLHLIAAYYGHGRRFKGDTFDDILNAPDVDELIDWLRHQPLLHHEFGYTMIHAAIAPQWDLKQAQALAKEVEAVLQSNQIGAFLQVMYDNEPTQWSDDLEGFDRIRFIINTFTRLRVCDENGVYDLVFKGPVESIPKPYMPWFKVPSRQTQNDKIIMGHWAALECKPGVPNIYALDSGAVWGNHLTAMRLEDGQIFTS